VFVIDVEGLFYPPREGLQNVLTQQWWRRPRASISPGETYHVGGLSRGLSELWRDGKDLTLDGIRGLASVGRAIGLSRPNIRPSTNEYESIPLDRSLATSPA
jgi:hypothetical protein